MVRHSILFIAGLLLLTGCDRAPAPFKLDRSPKSVDMVLAVPPPQIDIGGGAGGQQFSYSHNWSLTMVHDAVAARFDRARETCLKDRTLDCKLLTANLSNGGGGETPFASANLEVLLPHGRIAAFETALLAPVGKERRGDAKLVSRSIQAQSVENEAGDAGQKAAQLTAYRDRLALLANRPNLGVDDIIKLEAEQARVQGELDDALRQKRDLNDSVERESVTVQLAERFEPVAQPGPVAAAFIHAGDTFLESFGEALTFLIALVPWLPIMAGAIALLLWVLRAFRRRPKSTPA